MDEEALNKKEPEIIRERLRENGAKIRETRRKLVESNLLLGYGTDMLDMNPSYECGYEYRSMLKSGVQPFRALKAATSSNARILRRKDIGTIEPGKKADIAGWRKDILTDPDALLSCSFVMKDGVVYQPEQTISDVI